MIRTQEVYCRNDDCKHWKDNHCNKHENGQRILIGKFKRCLEFSSNK